MRRSLSLQIHLGWLLAALLGMMMVVNTAARAEEPTRGGTLTIALFPAPQILTSAFVTSGTEQTISAKISDGLFTYDFDLRPKPQLALDYAQSPDGLRLTLNLRHGVKWHDGAEFTSKDVAFSMMKVWKVLHGRGKTTFAHVMNVETPDAHTAILVLDQPSPGMLTSLSAAHSQILPAHIYEGTDILTNPANLKPIGTGPFKFESYSPGDNLVLVRNPDYWDTGKPYLDKLVFRFIPDGATRASALESGEVQILPQNLLPLVDVERLKETDEFDLTTKGYELINNMILMEFNLDNAATKDIRVRQAIAHAIDRQWIVDNILFGYGKPADSPLHPALTQLYDNTGLAKYEYNPEKSIKLLEEAGYKADANGTRLKLETDPSPYGDYQILIAGYLREAFRKVGIELNVQTSDYAGFAKRVYTDRVFQTTVNLQTGGPDPTNGTQRGFWSKSFQPGVAYSNGAHYMNEKMDSILERAAVATDPVDRKKLYHDFQKLAMEDLPIAPLVAVEWITISSKRVKDHTIDANGVYGNLASTYLIAE